MERPRSWRPTQLAGFVVLVAALTLAVPAHAGQRTCEGEPATIVGTSRDDVLRGTPGDDVIVGRGGDDDVFGLGGDDLVCAGPGDDEVIGGTGADDANGGPGGDDVSGGGGDDDLAGGPGGDELAGGAGDDQLSGGRGRDALDGGPGRDDLDGGAGKDAETNGESDAAEPPGEEPGGGIEPNEPEPNEPGPPAQPAVIEPSGEVVSLDLANGVLTIEAEGELITCRFGPDFPESQLAGLEPGAAVELRCVLEAGAYRLTRVTRLGGEEPPPSPPPVIEPTGEVVSLDLPNGVLTIEAEGEPIACRFGPDFPESQLVGLEPGTAVELRCVREAGDYWLTRVTKLGGEEPPGPPAVVEALGTITELDLAESVVVLDLWEAEGTLTCRFGPDFPEGSFAGISVGALVAVRCVLDGGAYWLTDIELTA